MGQGRGRRLEGSHGAPFSGFPEPSGAGAVAGRATESPGVCLCVLEGGHGFMHVSVQMCFWIGLLLCHLCAAESSARTSLQHAGSLAAAYEVLVPQPGIEPRSPALGPADKKC